MYIIVLYICEVGELSSRWHVSQHSHENQPSHEFLTRFDLFFGSKLEKTWAALGLSHSKAACLLAYFCL